MFRVIIIHHYVPSVVNRSAVMDLHRSRSCATLIQSFVYDIFVQGTYTLLLEMGFNIDAKKTLTITTHIRGHIRLPLDSRNMTASVIQKKT